MAEGESFEELLLELRNTRIEEKDGTRRARAEGALTYIPADKTQRVYESEGRFVFTAPLGAIEKEELAWYLERYYLWPIGVFQDRAGGLENRWPYSEVGLNRKSLSFTFVYFFVYILTFYLIYYKKIINRMKYLFFPLETIK